MKLILVQLRLVYGFILLFMVKITGSSIYFSFYLDYLLRPIIQKFQRVLLANTRNVCKVSLFIQRFGHDGIYY